MLRFVFSRKQFGTTDLEFLHYLILRNISDNNDFNAIKYLYDRLNIIDAKAQGLLTRNGLLLTAVSIVGSPILREKDNTTVLTRPFEQWMFMIGFILLCFSTISTFQLLFLTFDHVTDVPAHALKRAAKTCSCCQNNIDRNTCTSKDCDLALLEKFSTAQQRGHSIASYEKIFFRITLGRQVSLRRAQAARMPQP